VCVCVCVCVCGADILAADRDQWHDVIKLRVPYKVANFLDLTERLLACQEDTVSLGSVISHFTVWWVSRLLGLPDPRR